MPHILEHLFFLESASSNVWEDHLCHRVPPSDICVISDSGACATPGVDGGKAVSPVVLTHRLVVGELPGRLSLCTCHPATCCSLATTSRASTKDSGTPPPSCAAFQNTNRREIQEVFCDSHEWGAGQRRKSACVRGDKSPVVASITTFQLPAGWTLGWGEWSKWSGFES